MTVLKTPLFNYPKSFCLIERQIGKEDYGTPLQLVVLMAAGDTLAGRHLGVIPWAIILLRGRAMNDNQEPRGSLWHRWDPHLHAPGTLFNDQFRGEWEAYLTRIEQSEPRIEGLGRH